MKNNLGHIEAVIFDMDGVLFLSSDCHERAYREVLNEIGISDFSYASVAGMRTDEAMVKVLSERGRKFSSEELWVLVSAKRKKALELLETEGRIAPGSEQLVHALQERYRLALVSSASPQTVEFFIRKCGFSDVFSVVLDGSMVKEAKPSPEIYQEATKRLDIAPERCIVVEDASSGVRAGRNAGMWVVGVIGTESEEDLFTAGANFVVKKISDIELIFSEWETYENPHAQ